MTCSNVIFDYFERYKCESHFHTVINILFILENTIIELHVICRFFIKRWENVKNIQGDAKFWNKYFFFREWVTLETNSETGRIILLNYDICITLVT